MSIKRIGVLTSGGDAPGMNAAIRAVVRSGIYRGFQVYGIKKGYEGLLKGDMFEMNLRSVSDIMSRGGTILQTARSKDFATPEGAKRAARMAEVFQLDAIVVIGGDGSFRGARALARE
ncbi:MAG: 6-phosphofructokinase, partial [Clostridia bacterium]|nr:6-phosphofructokinase [Clostridia bacterium]